jgi:hypothetical protein
MHYLDELENTSIHILREAYANFKSLGMLWSMGKDSTVLLWLTRKAFFGHVPFPLIHIDTRYKIPEMIAYRDRLVRDWQLPMIVGVNEEDPLHLDAVEGGVALLGVVLEWVLQHLRPDLTRQLDRAVAAERIEHHPPIRPGQAGQAVLDVALLVQRQHDGGYLWPCVHLVVLTTKDTKGTKESEGHMPLCPSCPLWLVNSQLGGSALPGGQDLPAGSGQLGRSGAHPPVHSRPHQRQRRKVALFERIVVEAV